MNPLLLGGEMPHWSDSGPAGGPLLRELAGTAQGHTLIVGPHDFTVIDAVPARHVTVLVRGVPDAEALAGRYASRPGVEVCCGTLGKLAAVPAYDTVLALDGLDRTASTESAEQSWAAGLSVLLAVLRPGGRLLLGLANPVGLHRLLAFPAQPAQPDDAAASAPSGDAAWTAPPDDDPTRPAGLAELRDRLREAGLEVQRDYAAYPSPRAPAALLSESALTAPELHGFLSATLRQAGTPAAPMLADPRPAALQLLRRGLAGDLAPGWFVEAGRPGATPTSLPEALIATATVHRLTRGATAGWIRSDVSTGTSAPLPSGECLQTLLLTAVRRHDLPELRSLLTTWQSGETAGVDAAAILMSPGGRLHPLAPSGDPHTALRHLLSAIQNETLAEPEITALLGSMTGVRLDPLPALGPTPQNFRDLATAHGRLAQELSDIKAQLTWYEQSAATRDAELARAYRIITLLKRTIPGRAATAARDALRTGKRVARTALRTLKPNP